MKYVRKRRRVTGVAIGALALLALPAGASAAGNSALSFTGNGGAGNFVTFPHSNAYTALGTNLQVSASVNPDTVTGNLREIVSKPRSTAFFRGGFSMAVSPTGQACFGIIYNGGANNGGICSTATLPAGQFSSIVATYNGATLTLQINSAAPESVPAVFGSYATANTPIYVGRAQDIDDGRQFAGRIDDVRIGPIGGTPVLQALFNEGAGTAPVNSGSIGGTGTFSGANPPSYVALAEDPNAVTCAQTAVRRNGPLGFDQADVTLQSALGLEAVFNVDVENGAVSVPNFTPGQTTPLVITTTKATQNQITRYSFDASNVFNLYKHCE